MNSNYRIKIAIFETAAATGARSGAERSYPTSEVRGSGRECQAAAETAKRSYPTSEVSGGGREELPHV